MSYTTSHSDCPTSSAYAISKTGGGKPAQVACYDPVGRVIRTSSLGFDGTPIYSDTEYDSSGRVQFQSEPYFSNGLKLWVENRYDQISRVTKTKYPDYSENNIDYQGRKTLSTNRINQVTQQEVNALGEITEVIDALNGKVKFEFDPFGNLNKTLHYLNKDDSQPKYDTVLTYDNLGRKQSMADDDKGNWSYEHNAFGELVKQVDARSQTMIAEYDLMGRQTRRLDYNNSNSATISDPSKAINDTVWGYDIDVANNPILGKLALANINTKEGVPDYSERTASEQTQSYFYDPKGRPSRVDIDIDGKAFTTKTTYDQYGRVFQEFDASGRNQGIEKIYNTNGYLSEIKETSIVANSSQKKYLNFNKMNARQQLTEYQFDNGYRVAKGFDPETGYLNSINTTYLGISNTVQNISVDWDALGNLKYRQDAYQNPQQKEAFCYDSLNRLTSVLEGVTSQNCTGAVQEFKYDALGNITEKQGVGGYQYTSLRPHAVTSAGGVIYNYDNNGNVISDGNGRGFAYTTFDKPYRLKKGTDNTVNFWYGIDRERYKRKDSDGNQVLYVGNVEFHTNTTNGNVEIRRYLGGDIQVTELRNENDNRLNNTVQFILRDHLNSVQMLLRDDATATQPQIQSQMSFDAWGARRAADNWLSTWWDYNSQTSAINSILAVTNRGYTGHEMLDKIGVIHMNGRIYDPKLGRFLQADPIVQSPYDTQAYNRYSYVNNNPLKYTDPSGYSKLEVAGILGDIFQIVGSILMCNPVTAPLGWGLIAVGGMLSGYAQGDVGRGLATAVVSAYTFRQIGATFSESEGLFQGGLDQMLPQSLAGGFITVLRGGEFGHGFVTAGAMSLITPSIAGMGNDHIVARTLATSVIGGTVSELTGGKFANGAVTSAMAFAFGEMGRNKAANRPNNAGWETCDSSGGNCRLMTQAEYGSDIRYATADVLAVSVEITKVAAFAGVKYGGGFYYDTETKEFGWFNRWNNTPYSLAAGIEDSFFAGGEWAPNMNVFSGNSVATSTAVFDIGVGTACNSGGCAYSLGYAAGVGHSVMQTYTDTHPIK